METVIFPNILRASEPEPIQDQAQALGIGGGPDLMQAADYEPAEALSYAGGLEYAPTYGGGAVGGDAAAYGGAYYGSPASQPQPALQASMHSTPPQTPIGALEGDSGIDANIEYLNRYGDAEVRATISDAISRASIEHGVDANLIKAVIAQESAFSPTSLSSAGAQGLMQLMPDTADYLGVANPWDINQNIDGGTRLLSSYIDTYGGDLQLVLAAYNAGPGAVGKYGGVPPYSETKDYVRKVSAYYDKYRSEL
jgi:soluble lytic murein transglycosylase-like protein